MPPAPGRFSTTNRCPSRSDSDWHTRRPTLSAACPAGKPMSARTGRVGWPRCGCDGRVRARRGSRAAPCVPVHRERGRRAFRRSGALILPGFGENRAVPKSAPFPRVRLRRPWALMCIPFGESVRTPKAFHSKAQSRRASGALWVTIEKMSLTPKALHSSLTRLCNAFGVNDQLSICSQGAPLCGDPGLRSITASRYRT